MFSLLAMLGARYVLFAVRQRAAGRRRPR